MRFVKAQARPLITPEVVFNVWAYSDADGFVLRVAGKAYVMDGDDDSKLALLRQLAVSDFLSASWEKVPEGFSMRGDKGRTMKGVAHASLLSDPSAHWTLFGPLIERLEKEIPEQVRNVDGEYQVFRLSLPQAPLTITTLIFEHEDGRLVPMISPG